MPRRFNGSVPRPQARRFRVSVPDADESVLEWIGAQSDFSASVRALIRDAIERHGYRDATCYPVVQQPRRGRPPKQTELTELTVDGHPSPKQIVALGSQMEPKMDLLMVPTSRDLHEVVPDESSDALEILDDPGDAADAANTADASNIEDMLGALR